MFMIEALAPAFLSGMLLGVFAATRIPDLTSKIILFPLIVSSVGWALYLLVGLPNFGFPLFPEHWGDWYPFVAAAALFGSLAVALCGAFVAEYTLEMFGVRR